MENTNYLCKNCGAPMAEDQKFCPKCGTERTEADMQTEEVQEQETVVSVCETCGAELADDELFCTKCGQPRASKTTDDSSESAFQAMPDAPKKKKKTLMIAGIAAAAVVVIIVIVLLLTPKVNFAKVYTEIGGNATICTLADDGSYLKIDTNPYNTDNYIYSGSWATIQKANEALGFPESLDTRMLQTRAIDGVQTEEADRVTASWTYHPNKGLEVTYEKK